MHPVLRAQEEAAATTLPARPSCDYYAGGSGEEATARGEPRRPGATSRFRPRSCGTSRAVDTRITLLGATLAAPILVAPTALHGLAHPDGEAATAAGAAAAGSLLVSRRAHPCRSSRSPLPRRGPWWFQAYAMRDGGLSDRADRAGGAARGVGARPDRRHPRTSASRRGRRPGSTRTRCTWRTWRSDRPRPRSPESVAAGSASITGLHRPAASSGTACRSS